MILAKFSKVKQLRDNFSQSSAILTKEQGQQIDIEDFSTKNDIFGEKLWLFGPFSGDKGGYIDVWMIKLMIKTNQINMNVCFFNS